MKTVLPGLREKIPVKFKKFHCDKVMLNESVQNYPVKAPFFNSLFRVKKFAQMSCLSIDIIIFCLSLAFLYSLFQISNQTTSDNVISYLLLLGFIIISKYILSSLRLYLEVILRRNLISKIQEQFRTSTWRHENASVIGRLIGRDMTVLLEFISSLLRFIYFPIAMIIMLSTVYLLEGAKGIFSLSAASLFCLMSWYIAKKSIKFANDIYTSSKERIDKSSWFLNVRPYLKNWHELNVLNEINNLTRQEISFRNKDSFFRSLDLYIILFGSVLPVLILLTINLVSGKTIDHFLVIVLWFTTPMIGLIMEMGRFGSDYTMARRAYEELESNFNSNSHDISHDVIDLNETWEIWGGTLDDNLLKIFSPEHLSLCKELGLEDELKNRPGDKEIVLAFSGKNLSQGQRTRVLLIRAIHLAIVSKKTLVINISLLSLDPVSCTLFYKLLQGIDKYCQVHLTDEQQHFLQEQMNRSSVYQTMNKKEATVRTHPIDTSTDEKNNRDGFFLYYKKLMPLMGVLFTIPALFLSLNGYIISSNYSTSTKISSLVFITCISLLTAPLLGYLIEKKNRNKAFSAQMMLLKFADLNYLNDLIQRLSKDFTIMVERISWYIHDIAWYQSLIFITFCAIIYTSGVKGLLINVLFIFVMICICKLFSNSIKHARIESMKGVNDAVDTLQNLTCIGAIDHEIFQYKKMSWSMLGFERLVSTHVKMVVTKVNFTNLISVTTGIFIIVVVFAASIANTPKNEIIFLLSSLLAMEATIVCLFQALTGLNAQLLSFLRLDKLPIQVHQKNTYPVIRNEGCFYVISPSFNSKINTLYQEVKLKKGEAYSLSGQSGSGKSEYLKTISKFNCSEIYEVDEGQNNFIRVIYFGEKSIELLCTLNYVDFIDYVSNKILNEEVKLVIFDETFRSFGLNEVQEMISQLQAIITKTKSSLILVDHRFELNDNQIFIKNIIKE
ncbi:MAG: hypothetical protein K2X39_00245 [Silvanigrellaceae bacterium]|nr:hypothetical protein [Silvanigrellaceae bacterium]